MENYKIIRKDQFACSIMQVRRDKKLPVALLQKYDEAIISQAYPVFEIIDTKLLLPEYLMMWMTRSEFDRQACFLAVGGVRGSLDWDDFCDMELPLPTLEMQQAIVNEYNIVLNRIKINEALIQRLEVTAQALYKQLFVDFEFPDEKRNPYRSSGGEMVWNDELGKDIPIGWKVDRIENVSGLKYGKMLDSYNFLDAGYPVFSGYGIRGYHSEFMYKEPQILVLCRGVGGTGKVKLSPPYAYITNLSIIVEINDKCLNKHYYYYYLKNDNLRALDSGSAQSQITTKDLGFHQTLIPPKNIQEHFGHRVKTLLTYSKNIEKSTEILLKLRSLLQSKMTKIYIENTHVLMK